MPRGWKVHVAGIGSDTEVKSHVGSSCMRHRSLWKLPPRGILLWRTWKDAKRVSGNRRCHRHLLRRGRKLVVRHRRRRSLDSRHQRFIDEVDLRKRLIWIKNYRELV